MSDRAILSVKYTDAGATAGKAVSGVRRDVQDRDQHEAGERAEGMGGTGREGSDRGRRRRVRKPGAEARARPARTVGPKR